MLNVVMGDSKKENDQLKSLVAELYITAGINTLSQVGNTSNYKL